jgi:hypothetical protein
LGLISQFFSSLIKITIVVKQKSCKTILGVTTSTPNFLVYGKIGRYPIELQIKIKILCFWNKIVGNPDKLSGKIFLQIANEYFQ